VTIENEYSRKVIERRNIAIDYHERFAFVKRTAFLAPSLIIDVDESAASPDQFLDKYGWSPIGTRALRWFYQTGNYHYSVIAAYSINGFVYWEIVEDSVDSSRFIEFLRNLSFFCFLSTLS